MKDNDLIEKLRTIFVTIDVFNLRLSPMEKIVYGTASIVGLTVVGALIALVVGVKK